MLKPQFLFGLTFFLVAAAVSAANPAPKTAETQIPAPASITTAEALVPVRMAIEAEDRIHVRGYRGDVTYIVNENAKDISVSVTQSRATGGGAAANQDEWQFSFKRSGQLVQIYVDGPSTKPVWSEALATNTMPKYDLKIVGPSRALDINWYNGQITVAQLNSEVNITTIQSDILVTEGTGDLTVTTQEGSIKVKGRSGAVKVDAYQAKIDIENIQGELAVHNFTGETTIDNIQGKVAMSTYKGATKVAGVKGQMEFKNGLSPLKIERFEGELRGRTGQGAVIADIRGQADVRLESAEGLVDLRLPASGAWVNLGTAEGSLAVPSFLKTTRLPSQQIRTGRLRGANSGSVFVRTTSGDIRIR